MNDRGDSRSSVPPREYPGRGPVDDATVISAAGIRIGRDRRLDRATPLRGAEFDQ